MLGIIPQITQRKVEKVNFGRRQWIANESESTSHQFIRWRKTPILKSLFLYVTPRMLIKKNIEEVYADDSKITEELVNRYHKMALRVGNRKAFIDRAKTDFGLDSVENINKLKTIMTPTLLIWGAQDLWIPLANGIRMDRILVNSTLKVLENSGHVPMEENPKESLKLMRDFLN